MPDTSEAYGRSPSCANIYDMEGGCGYTQCTARYHRFCERCFIPWVGENRAYLWGKEGHFEGCLYRTRDTESTHSLKRRFELDDETEKRIEEKKQAKKQKREAKEGASC